MKTFNFKLQLLTFNFELLTSKGFQQGFIKITKKALVMILIFSILLPTIILYSLFIIPKKAEAAWYDETWAYRTSYSINNTGSVVTNQQVKLDIDTSTLYSNGKIQIDCDDSRFTDQNGNLLTYYIDTNVGDCNTNSTDYYIVLPTINTGRTIIYHYYGNPSASTGKSTHSSTPSLGTDIKAYWKLDEASGTRVDSTGRGNNLTDNNTVTQATGKVGNAAQFTAANSEYLSITDNSDLTTGTGSTTICSWAYMSTAAVSNVWGKTNGANTGHQLQYVSGGNGLRYLLPNRQGSTWSSPTEPPLNTWFFVCTWRDASANTINIQMNNGTISSNTFAGDITDSGSSFIIGSHAGGGQFWDGRIDGVGFWKKVLTADERAALYNGGNGVDFTSPLTFSPTSTTASSEEKGPGPVAYWRFDDSQGQTTQDSTTNNNDGTLGATSGSSTDDPSWQTEDMCVAGKCLKFDGSDDYVNVANTVSGTQTVAMWVRPTTTTASLITLNGTTSISATSGTISATGFTSPTIYVNGKVSSTLTANTWQHVAVTTGTAISASTIKIGNVSTSYITGFIDDVKIYNYARSAAQIQADFNARGTSKGTAATLGGSPSTGSGRPTLSDGLVGYWKMDEAAANSCTGGVNDNCDSSGNANDGAWNGDATSAAGKFGNGTTFDGNGDYVSVADNDALDVTSNITISAWVNPTNFSAFRAIISKGASNCSLNCPYDIYLSSNGIHFVRANASTYTAGVSTGTVTAGQWTHIAVVDDGTTIKYYINGSAAGSTSNSLTSPPTANAFATRIGLRQDGATVMLGGIDEVRIYNRALSPKEVEALYNFAPGPKVYLKMDEGTGTAANDSSGNANTGTVNSGTWTTGKYGKGVSVSGSSGSNVSVSDFSY